MDALSVEMARITTDDESFLAYKRAVFTYLTEFVARLTQTVPEVAYLVTALDPEIGELIDLAAKADEAPTGGGHEDNWIGLLVRFPLFWGSDAEHRGAPSWRRRRVTPTPGWCR
jgi:hypothetical protein